MLSMVCELAFPITHTHLLLGTKAMHCRNSPSRKTGRARAAFLHPSNASFLTFPSFKFRKESLRACAAGKRKEAEKAKINLLGIDKIVNFVNFVLV